MNVLIVEDDARIANFLMRGLRAEGYHVQHAATGPQGLAMAQLAAREAAQHGDQNLLVLDLMLPGLTGLEICQTLRASGIHMPILMLTAMSTLEDRVGGLRMGADDYLCKRSNLKSCWRVWKPWAAAHAVSNRSGPTCCKFKTWCWIGIPCAPAGPGNP